MVLVAVLGSWIGLSEGKSSKPSYPQDVRALLVDGIWLVFVDQIDS